MRFSDNEFQLRKKPYISVYQGAAAAMVGEFVRNYNPEQRAHREDRIFRTQGFRPVARLNVVATHTRTAIGGETKRAAGRSPKRSDVVCALCDGGPGNECACFCGMKVY